MTTGCSTPSESGRPRVPILPHANRHSGDATLSGLPETVPGIAAAPARDVRPGGLRHARAGGFVWGLSRAPTLTDVRQLCAAGRFPADRVETELVPHGLRRMTGDRMHRIPASETGTLPCIPADAGRVSAEVSMRGAAPRTEQSAKTVLKNAAGKFVRGAQMRGSGRPGGRTGFSRDGNERYGSTLSRDPAHGERNACKPSVSALNGISVAPIEKLVVFVVTPGVRISA